MRFHQIALMTKVDHQTLSHRAGMCRHRFCGQPFTNTPSQIFDPQLQTVLCGWLPRCKHKVMIWRFVGCSRLSGLLMQSV
jgi:hypothetical protein